MLGIFLDSETNGLNPRKHKIIELAFKILDIETGKEKDSYETIIFQSFDEWQKSDLESLQINGFNWEEISSMGQAQEVVSDQIKELFLKHSIRRGNAVFICQNPSFDRAFFSQLIEVETQESLQWPYHWLDLASMHWAKGIERASCEKGPFPWETGLSKDKIAQAYNLQKEKTPHRAINGVNHLILCYEAVVGFPQKP